MASTTLPPRPPAPAGRPAPTLVPAGGRQRRWSLALVAVLVTVGSALAFVVLWLNAGGREPVLALSNDVPAGREITADDLTVVRVASDAQVALVASSQRDDVIGRPAAIDMLEGTLLTPGAVGSASGLDTGTAVIAIPVPSVEIPTSDLATGDRVMLYRTVRSSQGGEARADTIGSARVFSVQRDDDRGSDIRVSVTVDEALAPAIASAVREDQIYLAKTSAGD
jgi:hypothetical protein